MGLFDSIMVTCPSCGKLTEVQSKAGKKMLLTYTEDHVPTALCSDLSGKEGVVCDECHEFLTIMSSVPLYGRVWAVKGAEHED